MNIVRLHIHHLRSIQYADISPKVCNVFLGDNGSGKTTVLEAIYLLSRGKSFRHHQPKYYITHGSSSTVIFAKLVSSTNKLFALSPTYQNIAVQKSQDATTELRLDGQTLATQSPLTQLLPTLLLEPVSLAALEQGSQSRRELLDWLVFHVEQNFHGQWLAYQRLLRQRNQFLKTLAGQRQISALRRQEITAWDNQLAEYAEQIHALRQDLLMRWQPYFAEQVEVFLPHYAKRLRLRYSAGFDSKTGLATLLAERLDSDITLGYTRVGSHRADIQVMLEQSVSDDTGQAHTHSLPAVDMLSRGERKLLMMAFRLSQLPLLQAVGKVPLVLIDDITAELDAQALNLLLHGLKQVQCQLFITSLSTNIMPVLREIWAQDLSVFHLDHGTVSASSDDG